MRTYTEERAGELKTIDIAKKLHTKMKFNQQNSSLDYRRNVDLLQKCTLISSLYVVRISMGRFDKILEANHQQAKKKTSAYYLPNFEKSLYKKDNFQDFYVKI